MNKQTLKALRGSIKKWFELSKGRGDDRGSNNCPLCKLFYAVDCNGCPVKEKTMANLCKNTPYNNWSKYHKSIFFMPFMATTPKARALAKAEYNFLCSLLPKAKKRKS